MPLHMHQLFIVHSQKAGEPHTYPCIHAHARQMTYLIAIYVIVLLTGLQVSHEGFVQSTRVQPALRISRRSTQVLLGVCHAACYRLASVPAWLQSPSGLWGCAVPGCPLDKHLTAVHDIGCPLECMA